MMNTVKVSVVIPAYNQAYYLRFSIQSVLDQTFSDYEIIVVDDGSTDNTSETAKRFGNRIRYIWQKNQGLAGARNTGIRASQGSFIALLDADDEWFPTYLEQMLAFVSQNTGASVYYCCAQAIDAQGRALPQIFGGPARSSENLYQSLLRANFIIPSTILMRRTIVIQAGLFDQNLRSCEDWDLWLRLLRAHQIVGTNTILAKYRIHTSSLSTSSLGMQKAKQLVVEKHFGLDDGHPELWAANKRRTYGGMYRYHALTAIQRQGDWDAGAQYLIQAFTIDPSLSRDLDLFYELALGTQPPGYRASLEKLRFEGNVDDLYRLLNTIFQKSPSIYLKDLRGNAYGTAHFAMGLLAYNLHQRSVCRRFFIKAILYRPMLLLNLQLIGDLIKSYLSPPTIEMLRKFRSM